MSKILEIKTIAEEVEEKFITFEDLSEICDNADGNFDPITIFNELCGLSESQLKRLSNHDDGIKGFIADNLVAREVIRRTTEYT